MKALFVVVFISCHFFMQAQEFQANYDESRVPQYVLPDVLRSADGTLIKSRKEWEQFRRSEVLALFENNVYGQMPRSFDSIRFELSGEDKDAIEGKAHLKNVVIEVFNRNSAVKINLVLFVPNGVEKPVPVFLLINNREKEHTDPARNIKSGFWPAELVIEAGYAVAAFHVDDLAPDDKDRFTGGALRLYPEQLKADNGMRAIGAWAWGASRVMDYFEKDAGIDSRKVVLVGHSRGGKTSLWAAAQDQRFAICVSNCSGNTGAALSRRQFGERIIAINNVFPHWFTNNYKKFNNRENDLPVDQHMLISLIAPRPVYATSATNDPWADPKGTFLALKHAEPVYSLYAMRSALAEASPAVNDPVIRSPIAYHLREGEHDMTVYDWKNFIKFADYHFNIKR